MPVPNPHLPDVTAPALPPVRGPHPTDFIPSGNGVAGWNAKEYGTADRGMTSIGGLGPGGYQQMTRGVHPWLPSLMSGVGSYLGLPRVDANQFYGRSPAFTPTLHGPTPYLEAAGHAAEASRLGQAWRGGPGGLSGLLSQLPSIIQGQQMGLPAMDIPFGMAPNYSPYY